MDLVKFEIKLHKFHSNNFPLFVCSLWVLNLVIYLSIFVFIIWEAFTQDRLYNQFPLWIISNWDNLSSSHSSFICSEPSLDSNVGMRPAKTVGEPFILSNSFFILSVVSWRICSEHFIIKYFYLTWYITWIVVK